MGFRGLGSFKGSFRGSFKGSSKGSIGYRVEAVEI